jgi:hypothetical protein
MVKRLKCWALKKEIVIIIMEGNNATLGQVLDLLQSLIGELPLLKPVSNFLAVTLMNINSVWHPTISCSHYRNGMVNRWTNRHNFITVRKFFPTRC